MHWSTEPSHGKSYPAEWKSLVIYWKTHLIYALVSLGRLASTTLLQYNGRRVKDEVDLVSSLNRNAFGSRNWTTAHLRLGEMQVNVSKVHLGLAELASNQRLAYYYSHQLFRHCKSYQLLRSGRPESGKRSYLSQFPLNILSGNGPVLKNSCPLMPFQTKTNPPRQKNQQHTPFIMTSMSPLLVHSNAQIVIRMIRPKWPLPFRIGPHHTSSRV